MQNKINFIEDAHSSKISAISCKISFDCFDSSVTSNVLCEIKSCDTFCECMKMLKDAYFYGCKGIGTTIEFLTLSKWFGASKSLEYFNDRFCDWFDGLDKKQKEKYKNSYNKMFGECLDDCLSSISIKRAPAKPVIQDAVVRNNPSKYHWETNYNEDNDSDSGTEVEEKLKFKEEEQEERKTKEKSSKGKHDLAYAELIIESEKRAIEAAPFETFIRKQNRKERKEKLKEKGKKKSKAKCQKSKEEQEMDEEEQDPTLKAIRDEIERTKQVPIPLNINIKSKKPEIEEKNKGKLTIISDSKLDDYLTDFDPPKQEDDYKLSKPVFLYNKNTVEEKDETRKQTNEDKLLSMRKELSEEENRQIYKDLGIPYPEPEVKTPEIPYEERRIWTLHVQEEKEEKKEETESEISILSQVQEEEEEEKVVIDTRPFAVRFLTTFPEHEKDIIGKAFNPKLRQDVFIALYNIKCLPKDIVRHIFGYISFACKTLEEYTSIYCDELIPKAIIKVSLMANYHGWYVKDWKGAYLRPRHNHKTTLSNSIDGYRFAVDKRKTWLTNKRREFKTALWKAFSAVIKELPSYVKLKGEKVRMKYGGSRLYATNQEEASRIFMYNGLSLLQKDMDRTYLKISTAQMVFSKVNVDFRHTQDISYEQLIQNQLNSTYEPPMDPYRNYSLEENFELFIDITVRLYPRLLELLETSFVPNPKIPNQIDEKKAIYEKYTNGFRLVCLYWASEWQGLEPREDQWIADHLHGQQVWIYLMGWRKKIMGVIRDLEYRKALNIVAEAEPVNKPYKDDDDKNDPAGGKEYKDEPPVDPLKSIEISIAAVKLDPIIVQDVVIYEEKIDNMFNDEYYTSSTHPIEIAEEIDQEDVITIIKSTGEEESVYDGHSMTVEDIQKELNDIKQLKQRYGKIKRSQQWKSKPVRPWGKQRAWKPIDPVLPGESSFESLYKQYYDWCNQNHMCARFKWEFKDERAIIKQWDEDQERFKPTFGATIDSEELGTKYDNRLFLYREKYGLKIYTKTINPFHRGINQNLTGGMRRRAVMQELRSPALSPLPYIPQAQNYPANPPPPRRRAVMQELRSPALSPLPYIPQPRNNRLPFRPRAVMQELRSPALSARSFPAVPFTPETGPRRLPPISSRFLQGDRDSDASSAWSHSPGWSRHSPSPVIPRVPFNTPNVSRPARKSNRVYVDPFGPHISNVVDSASFQRPVPQVNTFGLGTGLLVAPDVADDDEDYNQPIPEEYLNMRYNPYTEEPPEPSIPAALAPLIQDMLPHADNRPVRVVNQDPYNGEPKRKGRPPMKPEDRKYQKKYSRRGAPTKAEREARRLLGQEGPAPEAPNAPRLGPVEPVGEDEKLAAIQEEIDEFAQPEPERGDIVLAQDDLETLERAQAYDYPLADQITNVRKKDIKLTDEVTFSTYEFIFNYDRSGLTEALTGNQENFEYQTRHLQNYIENVMAGQNIIAWRIALNYNGPNDYRTVSTSYYGEFDDAYAKILLQMLKLFAKYNGEENVDLDQFTVTIRVSNVLGRYENLAGGKPSEMKAYFDELKSHYIVINPRTQYNCLWVAFAVGYGYKEKPELMNNSHKRNEVGGKLKLAVGTKNWKGGNESDVLRLSHWKSRPVIVYNECMMELLAFCPPDVKEEEKEDLTIRLLLCHGHYCCLLKKDDPVVKEHYNEALANRPAEMQPIEPKNKEYEAKRIIVYDLEAYRKPQTKITLRQGKSIEIAEVDQIAYACGWAFFIDYPEPEPDENELDTEIKHHEINEKWRNKGYQLHDYEFHGKMVTAAFCSILGAHCLDDALEEWMTDPYFHDAIFYAHNGGKYDVRLFMGQSNLLYKDCYHIVTEEQIELNGRIINLGVENTAFDYPMAGSKRKIFHHISLRDSIPLFGPSKLAKLCEEFKVPHKKLEEKVGIHELMFADTWKEMWTKHEMDKYFLNDCLGLLEVLQEFNDVCLKETGIPITAVNTGASLAKKYFLTHYYKPKLDVGDEKAQKKLKRMSRKKSTDAKTSIYTLTKEIDQFVREGYGGGRCEAFLSKAVDHPVYYYDFTSLYPDVARNLLPTGKPTWLVEPKEEKVAAHESLIKGTWNFRINQNKLFNQTCFWKVLVRSPNAANGNPTDPLHRKPLFGIKENNTYVFRWFEEWTEMVIYEPEILLAVEQKLDYEFVPVNAIFFETYAALKDCMERLFKQKAQATKDKKPALAQTWKIIINSLYGVWGLRVNDREGIEIARPEKSSWAIDLVTEKLMDIDKVGKYIITRREKDLDVKDCNVALAAAITSYARIKLYNLFMDIQNHGGRILYCDTDSVITDCCIENHEDMMNRWLGPSLGKDLGSLKNEITECIEKWNDKHPDQPKPHTYGFDKCIIVAPKLYYVCDKNEQIVKKAHKGFKENKESNDVVTYDRMYRLVDLLLTPQERYLEQTTVQWLGGNADILKNNIGVRLVERHKTMYQTINKGVLQEDGTIKPFTKPMNH